MVCNVLCSPFGGRCFISTMGIRAVKFTLGVDSRIKKGVFLDHRRTRGGIGHLGFNGWRSENSALGAFRSLRTMKRERTSEITFVVSTVTRRGGDRRCGATISTRLCCGRQGPAVVHFRGFMDSRFKQGVPSI